MQSSLRSVAATGEAAEVDVVGKFLAVECFFVVLNQVTEVRVPGDLGKDALVLSLLEVVLRPEVLVLGQDLLLEGVCLGLLTLLLTVGCPVALFHGEKRRPEVLTVEGTLRLRVELCKVFVFNGVLCCDALIWVVGKQFLQQVLQVVRTP